jgi:hypothetical protein
VVEDVDISDEDQVNNAAARPALEDDEENA